MRIRLSLLLIAFICNFTVVAATPVRSKNCVSIGIGKHTTDKKSKIKVTFVEMVEDSRCPVDVTCVWSGNANIKIRVSKNGRSKIIELNSALANNDNTFEGYTFDLVKLMPEPRSNIRINKNGYIATISLTKDVRS